MQHLNVVAEFDPNATLPQLEMAVKGLRVATEVAYAVEMGRVRRAASERMKFPSAESLYKVQRAWIGREADRDLLGRVSRHFSRMHVVDDDLSLFDSGRRFDEGSEKRLSRLPYDLLRVTTVGLNAVDFVLYEALVAEEVAEEMPGEVAVRSLQYGSPFTAWLFGKSPNADKTISATAQVLEVARDYGPKRKIGKAEARVAEDTVEYRVAESRLDVEIKEQQYREACARNDRRELENQAMRLRVGAAQNRQMLIDHAIRSGQLGIADAIQALSSSDADALAALGQLQRLEIEQREGDGNSP